MKGIQIPIVNENYDLIGFIDEFEYYKKLKKSFDEAIATTYTSCVGFDKNDLAMKGCAIDTMILNKYQYDIKETSAYMNGFKDGVRSLGLTFESKRAWITEALNVLSNQPLFQTKTHKAMKVLYRIDNFEQRRGIWRDWDGNWNPVFDEFLQDGVSKDLPMEDSKIYNGGWFAATESLETLIPHWVSFDDLRKLYEHGWVVQSYLCEEQYAKKLNEYETIFLKEKALPYAPFNNIDALEILNKKKTFTEKFYDTTPRDVYIIEQLFKENQQQ